MTNKKELDLDSLESVTGGTLSNMNEFSSVDVSELFTTIEEFESRINQRVFVYKKVLNDPKSKSYTKYREGRITSVNVKMNLAEIDCVDCKITINPVYDKNTAVGPAK